MHLLTPSTIVAIGAILSALCSASPVPDNRTKQPTPRSSSTLKSLHFARRDATGYQPRHLRPEEYIPMVKRDGISAPDLGQIATFTSGDPEPTRLALGATFLSNSNHEIDQQNVDNVAGPTTDAGMFLNLQMLQIADKV